MGKLNCSITLYDKLENVELIVGTSLNDEFRLENLRSFNKSICALGDGGRDKFYISQNQTADGGDGNDEFYVTGSIKPSNDPNKFLSRIDLTGGDGVDTVILNKDVTRYLLDLALTYSEAESYLENLKELRDYYIPSSAPTEEQIDIGVATVAYIISKNNYASISPLVLKDIERVIVNSKALSDYYAKYDNVYKSNPSLVDLSCASSAMQKILSYSTQGDYKGDIYLEIKSSDFKKSDAPLLFYGSDSSEKIVLDTGGHVALGSGDDVAIIQDGETRICGGEGKDSFAFDFESGKNNVVYNLTGNRSYLKSQVSGDEIFVYNAKNLRTFKADDDSFIITGHGSKSLFYSHQYEPSSNPFNIYDKRKMWFSAEIKPESNFSIFYDSRLQDEVCDFTNKLRYTVEFDNGFAFSEVAPLSFTNIFTKDFASPKNATSLKFYVEMLNKDSEPLNLWNHLWTSQVALNALTTVKLENWSAYSKNKIPSMFDENMNYLDELPVLPNLFDFMPRGIWIFDGPAKYEKAMNDYEFKKDNIINNTTYSMLAFLEQNQSSINFENNLYKVI